MTQRISSGASTSSIELRRTPLPAEPSTSTSLADRLADADFWYDWFRVPERDVALSLIRLRRFRCMSQTELAEQMGTKQPSIARWEAGVGNPRLSTLVEMAKAMNATVRVFLEPAELVGSEPLYRHWWERETACIAMFAMSEPETTVPLQSAEAVPLRIAALSTHDDYADEFDTGNFPVAVKKLTTDAFAKVLASDEEYQRADEANQNRSLSA